MPSRSPRRTTRKAGTSPLDDKQKALAAQEETVRSQMRKLEALIEEAPRRAEEAQRRRREELMQRSAYSARGVESRPMSLVDKRFDAVVAAAPRRRKSLKAERRQERLKFIMLFLLLITVLFILYSALPS
jgi:uncharacterized Rmd1/YagE family protein